MKVKHCAIGIAIVAAIVYFNTLLNGFVTDDQQLIFAHPFTKKIADWPAIFTSGHYAGGGGYRPLVTLSFAINYLIGGNNPIGYHALNIALHALNSALVFLLLRRLLRSFSIALVAALVFAVHPIHTEAIAWVSGRAELMAAGFFLGAWLLYLKSTGATPARAAGIISLFFFFAALLSKENALIFPLAIILGDLLRARYVSETEAMPKRSWRERLSILYPSYLGVMAFYFIFRAILYRYPLLRVPEKIQFVDNPLAHAPVLPRVLTAIKVQGDYLSLLAWPAKLCGDYSFNTVPLVNDPLDPAFLVSLGVIVILLAFAGFSFVRRGRAWFGILFYFLAIFPVSNLLAMVGTIKAERLLYLPSLGFCAVAGIFWNALRTRSSKRIQETMNARETIALALIVVVILAGGWRTWRRNRTWRNENRFWAETAEMAPHNFKALLNSGYQLLSRGRTEPAIAACRRALEVDPESQDARMNLGAALMQGGQNDEALSLFQEAVKQHPDRAAFHVDLGLAYGAAGKIASAVQELRRGSELDPKNPVLHFNLGLALSKSDDLEAALAEYRAAVNLKPDYAEGWNALGAVLLKLHRNDEARSAFQRALVIKPGYREAIYNITLLDDPR